MSRKERALGLRLTGDLAEALEEYCRREDRSLSSAVRLLLTRELERLGYLESQTEPKKKAKTT